MQIRRIDKIKAVKGLRWAITIGITLLSVPWALGVEIKRPWKDLVRAIPYFANHTITSLGVSGDVLFIGSTVPKGNSYSVRVYVMDLKSKQIKDLTQKLMTGEYDEVTDIRFNENAGELWLTTNGNGGSADCYDTELNLKARYSGTSVMGHPVLEKKPCDWRFVDEYNKKSIELPPTHEAHGSTNTLAFDKKGTVVGNFKGSVFYCPAGVELRCSEVYKPSDLYNWPISSVLTDSYAWVGTRGDGLILVDRRTQSVMRYPDNDYHSAR